MGLIGAAMFGTLAKNRPRQPFAGGGSVLSGQTDWRCRGRSCPSPREARTLSLDPHAELEALIRRRRISDLVVRTRRPHSTRPLLMCGEHTSHAVRTSLRAGRGGWTPDRRRAHLGVWRTSSSRAPERGCTSCAPGRPGIAHDEVTYCVRERFMPIMSAVQTDLIRVVRDELRPPRPAPGRRPGQPPRADWGDHAPTSGPR